MARAVVIGAGLGGLAVALRLQGQGYDVTVLEQRAAPGGRASQLRDGRLHVGHRAVADHDAVGPGGGVRRRRAGPALRGHAAPARPALPDPLGGRGAAPRLHADLERLREQIARFSARDAARARRLPRRAASRSTRTGILGAGRRAFPTLRAFARFCRRWRGSARVVPLHRVRRTPLPAPAGARGVLVPLAVHRRRPVPRAGDLRRAGLPAAARRRLVRATAACTRSWRRWRGRSTCAAARAVEAIETLARRRARGVALAGGERIAADVVISNADVLRTHELLGRRRAAAAAAARRCPASCSTSGSRPRVRRRCCTTRCWSGTGYRDFIRDVTRGRGLPAAFSTYVHAPARTEPAMAPPGGDSLARPAAGAEPARGRRLGARRRRAARRARRATSRHRSG